MFRFRQTLLVLPFLIGSAISDGGEVDSHRLAGQWSLISGEVNGVGIFRTNDKKQLQELKDRTFVEFHNGEISISIEGTNAVQRATFRIDEETTPHQIDLIAIDESKDSEKFFRVKLFRHSITGKEKKGEGIYSFDDGQLKICWRATKLRNHPLRPSKFESVYYYQQVFLVLKRVEK